MKSEFLIPKTDAENVQKIFNLYQAGIEHTDKLQRIKDPAIERIYQIGVRPKSGQVNDPDSLYSENVHNLAAIKSSMPNLIPEDNYGMLKPAATLHEWLFKRLCMDMKWLAKADEELMGTYLYGVNEEVKRFKMDIDLIKVKYPQLIDKISVKEFLDLNPEQKHYYIARLNAVTFDALTSFLNVIYAQWYPA